MTRVFTGSEIREALAYVGTSDVREAVDYLLYCDYEAEIVYCPVCDGVGHNCYYVDRFSR